MPDDFLGRLEREYREGLSYKFDACGFGTFRRWFVAFRKSLMMRLWDIRWRPGYVPCLNCRMLMPEPRIQTADRLFACPCCFMVYREVGRWANVLKGA